MVAKLTGGCTCGAVRYEAEADVEFSFNCHCRKCQRATGAGHASAFALPVDAVKITGDIKEHKDQATLALTPIAGFVRPADHR